ncbi:type III PLP-dependent enzyme [Kutzneria kofuensis]|uniref:ornithine decarboxylase n=1 Tax=Kutzneria kofuensis TaxID=103725 RepID=A0A7W9KMF7_9PSEU|nr:type III PLP-dependent enzyme [Kutzneria kofuensis]MBB5895260.1 ornithine decarboxylase [Kutzneria kofuensis]
MAPQPTETVDTATPPPTAVELTGAIARIREYLERCKPATPCLVVDLATIRERYEELSQAFAGAKLYYAVKANPAREVVRLLVELGAHFDVASPPEIDLCLAEGARPEQISYGNTIKKRADIGYAYQRGVRLFTTDSDADLEAIAEAAPGSTVFCRIVLADTGSLTPFGHKFGCAPDMATQLLAKAAELGLTPAGVSFHVGSQQLDPRAWDAAIEQAGEITAKLAAEGVELTMLNIGGGLPGRYSRPAPPLADFAAAITASVTKHFAAQPRLVLEPGRFLVSDAGLLRSEVVLVSRKSTVDDKRWVYLDVGRYNGLAETENEYITYLLSTPGRDGETGPVCLAGPTCDGDDVLYQHNVYRLPMELRAGDHVDFLNTGAYTASYSSIAFNGFAPLPTHCV